MKLARLLLVALVILAVSGLAFGQSISEKTYPQQFGSPSAYESATGNMVGAYSESPLLADRVAAGELPPVEERLPDEPVVVEPLDAIGVYGGELAGPATSPTCCGWDVSEMVMQKLFTIDTDLQSIIPNIASGYTVSDDLTQLTVYLREGHKWSDGHPFTSEDFRFWFEDILWDQDVTGGIPGEWRPGGEKPTLEVIDETTVRYTFAIPHPSMIVRMASNPRHRGFRAAHYFKQFHIKYNPDADKLAVDEGFDGWSQMLNARLRPNTNTGTTATDTVVGIPTLNTFMYVGEDSFGNKNFERNPYFFKVDIAGNQLPYTDGLRRVLVEDLQVQDLRAIAGEYSHFGWGKLLSVPTYRENEEAGNYRVALVTYNRGNEYSMMFNLTHPDPVMREIFNDVRFRQAMSVAIDRNEINELIYFGLATPSQSAPTPDSNFYEPWMTDHFAEYDPDRANALLDEIGLDQRDGEGFRLRPDGETLFINMQVAVPEEAWGKIAELVVSYWNAVGVKSQLKLIERGLYTELRGTGGHDIAGWGLDIVDIGEFSGAIGNIRPNWGARAGSKEWFDWLNSGGAKGTEPPEDIKELWDLSQLWLQQPYGSDSYLEIGKQFHDMTFRGLYQIGTVQRPPQPLLFKKTLKNTPPNDTEGLWSFSYRQWVMFMPEQWYYEDGS